MKQVIVHAFFRNERMMRAKNPVEEIFLWEGGSAKKIDFILDGSTSLLYGNPTYDLTDDVLFELRKYSVSDKDKKTQEK